MKTTKLILTIALGLVCLSLSGAQTKDTPKRILKADPVAAALKAVPAPELPAQAAQWVAKAKARERLDVTLAAVKAGIEINPAAAPAVVGAIARAVPEMAGAAAGKAAALQPKQAVAITKAAAAAAPAKVGAIVFAVCQAVPAEYRNVAAAASEAVPGAAKEILQAVSVALPSMEMPIQQAAGGTLLGAAPLSVAAVLDRAVKMPASTPTPSLPAMAGAAGQAKGASLPTPFIPLTGTPTNAAKPGLSGYQPAGGENYAEP